jgi:thiamine pyrophosphate-dependent acetolactate synthase large subunit-like protein
VPAIDVVVAKHEGAAANMAEADGKLTGRPGIRFVTRGPGATQASTGIHTAFQDSTPMILFIGQIDREFRDREGFQEVDYRAMFGPLAKWVAEIDDAARVPEYLSRAFQCATSGRPGPVVLALPEDMLSQVVSVADTKCYRAVQSAPNAEDIAAIGLPAAIAAKLRHPGRQVICVAGDGDFLMYPQELSTAMQYGAPIIVLVVNNGLYGAIRMHQFRRFPGRISATRIEGPDMVTLAKSFGAYAERVESTDAFEAAFERAIGAGRMALLDLIVDPKQITPSARLADRHKQY